MTLTQKRITSIAIKDRSKNIGPNGETRLVTIKGDPTATFTLTATTVSGCSILEEEIENFQLPSSGEYKFNIKFPKLDATKVSETFTIETTPAADTKLESVDVANSIYDISLDSKYSEEELKEVKEFRAKFPIGNYFNIESKIELHQYKNPTITFTNTSTQTGPALTVTGTDVTKTGKAETRSRDIIGYTPTTYTLTIVENPADTGGYLYVKNNANLNDNITDNKTIKKVVRRETVGEATPTTTLRLSPAPAVSDGTTIASTGMATDSSGNLISDLTPGMSVKGCVSYTKTVFDSVETSDCYLPVDQFNLSDTDNIFEGMIVSGKGIHDYPKVVSIDCDGATVTLSSKYVIRGGTTLKFEHCINTSVRKVETNNDVEGKACITIPEHIIPDFMELSFAKDETIVNGTMKHSGSGSNGVTLTTELDVVKFGKEDVTKTLNLDNFIITKPNAFDQDVLIKKDTGTSIYMLKGDYDDNIASKTVTVTANPKHGAVGAWDSSTKTIRYTPDTGFTGLDSFSFTVSDGVNSSDEKKVFITVN
jgi:hypothetical protein